jgi:hypothetical protein
MHRMIPTVLHGTADRRNWNGKFSRSGTVLGCYQGNHYWHPVVALARSMKGNDPISQKGDE